MNAPHLAQVAWSPLEGLAGLEFESVSLAASKCEQWANSNDDSLPPPPPLPKETEEAQCKIDAERLRIFSRTVEELDSNR